jgi:hypothetical protein
MLLHRLPAHRHLHRQVGNNLRRLMANHRQRPLTLPVKTLTLPIGQLNRLRFIFSRLNIFDAGLLMGTTSILPSSRSGWLRSSSSNITSTTRHKGTRLEMFRRHKLLHQAIQQHHLPLHQRDSLVRLYMLLMYVVTTNSFVFCAVRSLSQRDQMVAQIGTTV